MKVTWTGIAEGDRICTTTGRWGSIVAGKRLSTPDPIYKVRYDDAPDELHWIGSEDIDRLHRGAGDALKESTDR